MSERKSVQDSKFGEIREFVSSMVREFEGSRVSLRVRDFDSSSGFEGEFEGQ